MKSRVGGLIVFLACGVVVVADAPATPDKDRVARLVDLLDDGSEPIRQQVNKALGDYGKAVVPLLKKELKKNLRPGVKRRVKKLIEELGPKQPLDVAATIRLLGADSFEIREQATRDLIRVGRPAVPLLEKAVSDPDLEVRNRARKILETIPGKP